MGRLGPVLTVFLILFEISLFFYYYRYLVPAYNAKEYTEKPIIDPAVPANCSIFLTQNEAQSFYRDNAVTHKLGSLDNDNDGIVCENLP
jgi:hypothetical protein